MKWNNSARARGRKRLRAAGSGQRPPQLAEVLPLAARDPLGALAPRAPATRRDLDIQPQVQLHRLLLRLGLLLLALAVKQDGARALRPRLTWGLGRRCWAACGQCEEQMGPIVLAILFLFINDLIGNLIISAFVTGLFLGPIMNFERYLAVIKQRK